MKKILLTLMFVSYLNVDAQNPIQEFNFNGSLNNADNSSSFLATPNFVNDRMGALKGAQQMNNKAMEAVIENLPQENNPRTISVWIKFNDITTANYIWGYGTAQSGQYFGLLQQGTTTTSSDLSLAGWGASNDVIVPTPLRKDTWYNYSVTFDGTVSKIYRDGKVLKSISGLSRNTKGNVFRLGEVNTTVGINAAIDDLKIYNVAMTDEQVVDLYETTKPKVTVGDKAVAAKPTQNNEIAKAKPTAVIKAKTVNTSSKMVEVFSQGRKVLGVSPEQEININDLPEGTYLLKITNSPSKKVSSN